MVAPLTPELENPLSHTRALSRLVVLGYLVACRAPEHPHPTNLSVTTQSASASIVNEPERAFPIEDGPWRINTTGGLVVSGESFEWGAGIVYPEVFAPGMNMLDTDNETWVVEVVDIAAAAAVGCTANAKCKVAWALGGTPGPTEEAKQKLADLCGSDGSKCEPLAEYHREGFFEVRGNTDGSGLAQAFIQVSRVAGGWQHTYWVKPGGKLLDRPKNGDAAVSWHITAVPVKDTFFTKSIPGELLLTIPMGPPG